MFLDYLALGMLFFVIITLLYIVIVIHDIPYEIAKHRDHPHQDAIHAAGWVSLFTRHALWPFLWIWAMAYRPERGWGFGGHPPAQELRRLEAAVVRLEDRLALLERRPGGSRTDGSPDDPHPCGDLLCDLQDRPAAAQQMDSPDRVARRRHPDRADPPRHELQSPVHAAGAALFLHHADRCRWCAAQSSRCR